MIPSAVQMNNYSLSHPFVLCIIKFIPCNLAWNLLSTSSWSLPSKVGQHVALSLHSFSVGARSGSVNEISQFITTFKVIRDIPMQKLSDNFHQILFCYLKWTNFK